MQIRLRIFLVLALVASTLWISAPSSGADDLPTPHPTLVPEEARFDFPQIIDGTVHDVVVVGPYIVAGGSFTTIERNDGTTFSQPYLAAFDIDSGEYVDEFAPVLNGSVLAVSEAPELDLIFVGGEFTDVNGVFRNRLAQLSLADGSVTDFVANATGKVQDIDLEQGRLFVGGAFNQIKGHSIDRVAELDPITGSPNVAFGFDFAGEGSAARSGGQNIKHLEITNDGNRLLVVHSAAQIDGSTRPAAAIFDIEDPAAPFLTDFDLTDFFADAPDGAIPTDADMAPDGSYFAMSTVGGNKPPWNDMVLTFPMDGGANTQPLWAHNMRDSVFSVAVSNNAVYAGGHFCFIESGPGTTNDDGRVKVCTGDAFPAGAWRWQLAALDPADGTPLDWDPGSNALVGVQALTVTDRGLLLGQDGNWAGSRYTGRFAFFDFGGQTDVVAPTVDVTSPIEGESVEAPVLIEGTAADDFRVDRIKIRLKDVSSGLWMQADGTFAATVHDFITEPSVGGANTTVDWSLSYPSAPIGDYRAEVRAVDRAGNNSVADVVLFEIGTPVRPVVKPFGVVVPVEGDTGQQTAHVLVEVDRPAITPITIDWTTVDLLNNPAVAASGTDYLAASGTLTIEPGESSATVPIEILGDTEDEPPLLYGEWGVVSFSNISPNADLDTSFFGLAIVIIIDDD